jgi:hypothetical protein
MITQRKLFFLLICIFIVWTINFNSVPCPRCDCPESVNTIYIHQTAPTLNQPAKCVHSRDIKGIWNIESFVLCASQPPDRHEVSVLTQLTLDRFDTLIALAERWSGPLSVALYVPKAEYFVSEVKRRHQESEPLRRFADIHIIYEEDVRYPVNHLRNLALQNARTQYVIMLDVDFIPNPQMHGQLRKAAEQLEDSNEREALVVPAFEVPSGQYPNTKAHMVDLMKKSLAYQVHYFKGMHAHLPTNYERWASADEPYEVQYEYTYEPYVLIRRDICPLYDERFIGYGNDKSAHAYELAAAGFRFFVLPDPFVIHKDHPSPAWRSDQGSGESWQRWVDFTKDMTWKYGFKFEVPQWLKDACNQGDCPQFWLF